MSRFVRDLTRACLGAGALVAGSSGCDDGTIPAHAIDLVIQYGATTTHAVVMFPSLDPDASSGCASFGSCSTISSDRGTVVDDGGMVERARHSATRSSTWGTYEVNMRRSDEDQQLFVEISGGASQVMPYEALIGCTVTDGQLGQPVSCYYTTEECTVVVTVRE